LDMPAGPPLCRLAPSERRTNESGSGLALWPTPTAGDGDGGHIMKDCTITGKATDGRKINVSLAGVARLMAAHGAALNGSTDPTASSAGLDPAFACWLMGMPLAVDACAPTAIASSRNSAPPSSKPSSKHEPLQPEQKEHQKMNDNPYRELAASMRSKTGFTAPMLLFTKGDWVVGKDTMNDQELIALPDLSMRGWCKLQDSKPVDFYVGFVRDRYMPPKRDELGDTDPRKWEKTRRGEPKDPWQFTYYVPMANPETAQVCIFSTTSQGGKEAWADLLDAYADSQEREDAVGKMPRVALRGESYDHWEFGKVHKPIFKIVGWETPPAIKPIRAPSSAAALAIEHVDQPLIEHKPAPIDDDIPF
jgi:hypothetical protein